MTVSLIFIIGIAYFFYGLQPSVPTADAKEFKVAKGEGVKEIGARLSQLSLIKSIGVFKFYSLISGNAQQFKPGVYELAANMSVPQIVETLTAGVKDVRVVIPEGLTVADIDDLLRGAGVLADSRLTDLKVADFEKDFSFLAGRTSFEGFFFPDTYHFKTESEPAEVAVKLLNVFKEKAWPILKDEPDSYSRLILASLLEREVPSFIDRQVVAGILLKRLRVGMPLQVDATVTYAKCGGAIRNCPAPVVSRDDLKFVSLYNTYQHLGLPPTPIANPGQAALKAAVTPVESAYWYYLSAASTRQTIFSKTLDEHNNNRAKYL